MSYLTKAARVCRAATGAFLFLILAVAASHAATIYGVNSTNQLVRFDSSTPGTVAVVGTITGLQPGENVLGIDFRPANGQLYGLGSASRLYAFNLLTAAATQIGASGAFTLNGTDFGFDFNPTVDRIRVVSNTGQNLRLHPDTGALAATDTPLNPGTPDVGAAAYTNNFAGSTTTTLYDIDATLDSLFTQVPPNAGTLNLVGPLGVNTTGVNGFDIAPQDGIAYAALTVGGSPQFYRINLGTGAATLVGAIGGGVTLRGISVGFGTGVNGTSVLDFDGDRRSDYAVFRTSSNTWFINRSSNNSFFGVPFGLAQSDVLTPGDYDGDGRTDISVWRSTNGIFFYLRSSDNTVGGYQFGLNGDEPIARDYDGDSRTDFAVARRQGGQIVWYINNSGANTFRIETFGLATDIVAPADYDGDGRCDLATYRGENGQPATFYTLRSTAGYQVMQFGQGGDLVVPGDYDGDGKADLAVVRQGSEYTWFVLRSSNNSFFSVDFGRKPFFTTQGDYDGDGRTDISVWDPATGIFYALRSSNAAVSQYRFGQNGDYPVANVFTH